jgi:hypothetical protein
MVMTGMQQITVRIFKNTRSPNFVAFCMNLLSKSKSLLIGIPLSRFRYKCGGLPQAAPRGKSKSCEKLG